MNRIALGVGVTWLILAGGCAHQRSGGPAPGVDMSRYHTYFIVSDKPDNPVAQALKKDLLARGFAATIGLDWAIPPDAQVKVIFKETWNVDITPYLANVQIDLIDAQSGAHLASGTSSRSSAARKPAAKIVHEVTDLIFHTG